MIDHDKPPNGRAPRYENRVIKWVTLKTFGTHSHLLVSGAAALLAHTFVT